MPRPIDDQTPVHTASPKAMTPPAEGAATDPLRVRLARLRAEHELPPATGQAADKPFFDRLWGET